MRQVTCPRAVGSRPARTVDYIDVQYVSPGDPILSYPVNPIFNFLADRPNPTRFDHFIPGTLTDGDFHEVIARSSMRGRATSIWDHLNVLLYGDRPHQSAP